MNLVKTHYKPAAGRQDILPFAFLTTFILFLMLFGKKIKKGIVLLIPLFFMAGCGIWTNLTAYFNLYYNTTRLFHEAESEVLAQRTDVFSTTVTPLTTATDQKLQKVIEKCSNMLQFKSDSKYVDDALMMLGKTFYYQQNYLKAEHEFQELLDTQRDSDLRLEAQLWLGMCQMELADNTAGLQTLDDVKKTATENKNDDILQADLIEELKYKISSEDYQGAIQSSKDFLKVSGDNSINAKVAFELGKLYELVNDDEDAAKAFASVLDYSPTYDMEFNARLSNGVALRNASHLNEAYKIFSDMSSQDKYKDHFDEINFQKGVTLVQLGNYVEALNVLTIVDTTYKNTLYTGAARYEIGKLYEYNFANFDSANAYYLKARSTLLPPEYIVPLSKKIDKFRKYNELRDDLYSSKTQLEYVLDPEKYLKDSTAYYKQLDSIQLYNKELQTNNNTQSEQFNQNLNNTRSNFDPNLISASQLNRSLTVVKSRPPERPVIPIDSIKSKIVFYEYEFGNLFYSDFNLLDSAYYYYTDVLKNYPNSTWKPKTLFVLGNYYLAVGDTNKADSVFNYIYENYKNDRIVNEAATILNKPLINFDYDPANNIYAKADSALNKKEYYSSISQLSNIYNNYPQSQSAPKALYAEGWIFENILDKPDSAAILYDSLKAKYPKSEYAINVSPRLELYHMEKLKIKKAIEDSLKTLQRSKEEMNQSDTTKTTKVNLEKEKVINVHDENAVTPPLRKAMNDTLKEKGQMMKPDSLIKQERKLNIKDEIQLKDSSNRIINKVLEDTSKVSR